MGVGVGERPPRRGAGGRLAADDGRTDAPGAHRSCSRTGIEKGDEISAAATRSIRRASVPERPRPPAN